MPTGSPSAEIVMPDGVGDGPSGSNPPPPPPPPLPLPPPALTLIPGLPSSVAVAVPVPGVKTSTSSRSRRICSSSLTTFVSSRVSDESNAVRGPHAGPSASCACACGCGCWPRRGLISSGAGPKHIPAALRSAVFPHDGFRLCCPCPCPCPGPPIPFPLALPFPVRASDLVDTVRPSEFECACDCDRFREGRRGRDIDDSVASPPPPPPPPLAAREPGDVGAFTRGATVWFPKNVRSAKKSMLPPPAWPLWPKPLPHGAHALVLERTRGLHLPRAALALEVLARLEHPAFANNKETK
ncbi:hypothetical protein HETIRDRAFT_420598 [Heterobasidion irregulare TC 32-1]|uniref:Uncharacterized protein n=1 Tax=Heterobasidion irregulare (strain TC 32-1) TaxID=747525 RepID=W4JWC2_HETIT|nr:uncharacterized protein HETIRDRAFT_420598 [Heterobasidion irregulare TC 32-1]ETW77764.1 hypothetical protein HETIRDRAFT_420598 [Heterobasidion irregulare TC 32-1]